MDLGDVFLSIKSTFSRTVEGLLQRAGKILQGHIRLVMIFLGGLGIILCLLVVLGIVSYRRTHPPTVPPMALSDLFDPLSIPPEELFMPDEPDFLPDVLWEQESRESWTSEDALPFWTDPLKGNRRVWQGRVEGAIDELLERLP
ncbi:MAG: hypothetical protein LBG08_07275 [Spirochaetaceae bacterium]|jgi:hypothetical protein|nr:hypothetical protein [Spirochaetaceae bacterium]